MSAEASLLSTLGSVASLLGVPLALLGIALSYRALSGQITRIGTQIGTATAQTVIVRNQNVDEMSLTSEVNSVGGESDE